MMAYLQQLWEDCADVSVGCLAMLSYTFQRFLCQLEMYVHPTVSQRLDGVGVFKPEFAYQKVDSRFDIYSIRAIIRDDTI